jgi:phage-related protein
MTSEQGSDIKAVEFITAAKRDFEKLPTEIRKVASRALTILQNGGRPVGDLYRELTGNRKLAGIGEIREIGDDGNAYRIYNVVSFPEVIYVIEAGVKKSHERGEIPKETVARLVERAAAARADYEANKKRYQEQFRHRQERRGRLEQRRWGHDYDGA